MRKAYLFFAFLLIGQTIFAVTWIGGTGDWENPSNWNTGQVPGPNELANIQSGLVYVSSFVSAGRVSVSSGASLTILSAGTLNFYNSSHSFYLSINGTLTNYGEITGSNNGGNLPNHCIILNGNFDNYGTITFNAKNATGINVGSSGVFYNGGELFLNDSNTGVFNDGTFENDRFVEILNSDDDGIRNDGDFYNAGSIQIESAGGNGIHNSNQLTNEGIIQILETTFIGVRNQDDGTVFNSSGGIITIDDTGLSGIFNFVGFFENRGRVDITNPGANHQGLQNADEFFNLASGKIYISDVAKNCLINSGLFKNYGLLDIDASPQLGGGINNNGNFRNLANGVVDIEEAGNRGINNFSSGLFVNQARINIHNISGTSIYNTANFKNRFGGLLRIYNLVSGGRGISNQATFLNKNATIDYFNSPLSTFDISNNGSFTNSHCGNITSTQEIINGSAGSLFNNAFLTTTFNGLHVNNGTFINNGVIGDYYGAFDNMPITNNSVIAGPVTDPAYIGQPVQGILTLGSLNNATVIEWTTNGGSNNAGIYDPVNNTFTPNANANMATLLYLEIRLSYDISCGSGFFRVPFEQGITYPPSPINSPTNPQLLSETKPDFQVYPNPSSGDCTVTTLSEDFLGGKLSVLNTHGQILREYTVDADSEQLKMTNLSPGVYFLRMQSPEGESVTKRLAVSVN